MNLTGHIRSLLVTFALFFSVCAYSGTWNISDQPYVDSIWHMGEHIVLPPQSDLEDALSATNWQDNLNHPPGFGFTESAVWYRVQIQPDTSAPERLRFYWHHAQIRDVDVYLTRDNQVIEHVQMGSLLPMAQRPMNRRMLEWELNIPAAENQTLYIRAYTEFALSFRIAGGDPDLVEKTSRFNDNLAFLFIGLMVALFLYNLPMALSFGHPFQWYYLGYLTAFTLYIAILRGHLFEWGIYSSAVNEHRFALVGLPLIFIFSLLFVYDFLRVKNLPPIFQGLFLLFSAMWILLIVLGAIPDPTTYLILVPMAVVGSLIYILTISLTSFLVGNKNAFFIFIGWLFMFLGITGHQISVFIGVEADWISQHGLQLGAAMEAFMFSWAISYRFRDLHIQNRELKVSNTSFIQEANTEIQHRRELEQIIRQQKQSMITLLGSLISKPLAQIRVALKINADSNEADENVMMRQYLLTQGAAELGKRLDKFAQMSDCLSGSNRPNPGKVSINTLTTRIQELALELQESGQQWQLYSMVDPDFKLITDQLMLESLLTQIIENAFHATRKGRIKLQVKMMSEENQEWIEWLVEDSGRGMNQQQLNYAFDLISLNQDNSFGYGIGLPLAKKLALLLGGDLSIHSEPGKGTTLRFIQPINISESELNMGLIIPENNNCVLIIEPSQVNSIILQRHLEKMELSYERIPDETNAIHAIKTRQFIAILLSSQIIGIESQKLVRTFKERLPDIPVLAISEMLSEADINDLSEQGFSGYIDRPVRFEKLKDTFEKLNLIN